MDKEHADAILYLREQKVPLSEIMRKQHQGLNFSKQAQQHKDKVKGK